MDGVDIADQFRSYYYTQLTSFRTWYPMFFWALDTSLINFYIIYCDCSLLDRIEHKEFLLQVAWDLILDSSKSGYKRRAKKQASSH